LDHYLNSNLELVRNTIDDTHVILLVKSFPTFAQAQGYYRSFVMNQNTMKNVKYQHTPVIISESNYSVLEADKKVNDYIEFFKKEYLRQ
ncbi:MAG: hypothetical protein LBQ60_19080, partial [Bacteroidales bacterium]|nr:hypothetical protein [Bacteroidales bacterium]